MEIGAIKAVQDRLKTTKIEESKGASLVFCWDTHLTKIKGRNVLFIGNSSNSYTMWTWTDNNDMGEEKVGADQRYFPGGFNLSNT